MVRGAYKALGFISTYGAYGTDTNAYMFSTVTMTMRINGIIMIVIVTAILLITAIAMVVIPLMTIMAIKVKKMMLNGSQMVIVVVKIAIAATVL